TEMRLLMQRSGFGAPVVNYEIRAPGTDERFRLDLSYPQLRIAVEYDGFWHSTDRKRHRADRRKDDVLHEMGWRVVRASDRGPWGGAAGPSGPAGPHGQRRPWSRSRAVGVGRGRVAQGRVVAWSRRQAAGMARPAPHLTVLCTGEPGTAPQRT